MADPFEVRMRFTSQLQHLNASVTSAQKAAHYALKNRDMDEDLHSCILEQLERNNLNLRANILYFLEHLCDMAAREEYPEFIRMMERDILKIVDLVAPEDGSGAANVKVVRKVLKGMGEKSYLQPQTVMELEECIKDRDQIGGVRVGEESPMVGDVDGVGKERARVRMNGVRLDKRQIEQRIEEDRERHKRLRESIWAVEPDGDKEFDRLWEETSDVNADDFILIREEAEERRKAAKFHRMGLE
ncbi:CTD kinase subunit gamma CTK3-domain-containing protein [Elsinoe ampelina]|uniref:CTD kinase subunit gamma CTK3-domain-containing protein n=1 Tax=Elsinoe ampelina TaxID=302913 RepID=A0A6A6GRB5_9PEZI|nr:CTD kinase subunit gamma CTK3-domain-containing protein [Elsinoe ampelina]